MNIPYSAAALTLALIAATSLLGGCETTSQVTWQDNGIPNHVHPWQPWWRYEFLYHPNAQAYYEPYTQQYFWYQDGAWRQGEELPIELALRADIAHVVKLQHDLPYLQHDTVRQWWPPRKPCLERFDPTAGG